MKGCPQSRLRPPRAWRREALDRDCSLQSPNGMTPLALGPGAWSARLEKLRPQVHLRLLRPQAAPGSAPRGLQTPSSKLQATGSQKMKG